MARVTNWRDMYEGPSPEEVKAHIDAAYAEWKERGGSFYEIVSRGRGIKDVDGLNAANIAPSLYENAVTEMDGDWHPQDWEEECALPGEVEKAIRRTKKLYNLIKVELRSSAELAERFYDNANRGFFKNGGYDIWEPDDNSEYGGQFCFHYDDTVGIELVGTPEGLDYAWEKLQCSKFVRYPAFAKCPACSRLRKRGSGAAHGLTVHRIAHLAIDSDVHVVIAYDPRPPGYSQPAWSKTIAAYHKARDCVSEDCRQEVVSRYYHEKTIITVPKMEHSFSAAREEKIEKSVRYWSPPEPEEEPVMEEPVTEEKKPNLWRRLCGARASS